MPIIKRADIQGMRGLAVLVVVAFHANLGFSAGHLGVDAFLVISGHVITNSLRARTLSLPALVDFGRRRVRRLMAPLMVMVGTVLLLTPLVGPIGTRRVTAETGLAAVGLSANVYLAGLTTGYFAPASDLNPLLHTWSLSLEEQFYLLFPAVLLGAAALANRWSRNTLTPVLLTVALALSASLVMTDWATPSGAFYGLPTRAWQFLLGALTTFVPTATGTALSWLRGCVRATALAVLVLVAAFGGPAIGAAGSAVTSLTVAVLLAVPATPGDGPEWLLTQRPMTWIGDRSYSWYLWHWPVLVLVRAWRPGATLSLLAAAASLPIAAVAHRHVEERFRHRRWGPGTLRNHALAALGVGLLGLAVAATSSTTPDVGGHQQARLEHADEVRGCATPEPLGARGALDCNWRVPGPVGEVVLIGDSTAGMFSEAVLGAAAELRLDATIATYQGCPFALVAVARGGSVDTRCRDHVRGTLDALTRRPPDVVVLSIGTDVYLARPEISLDGASESGDQAAALGAGLALAVAELTRHGMAVVVVETIPKFEPWTIDACSTWQLRRRPAACAAVSSRAELDEGRRIANDLERAAVASAGPLAASLDLSKDLCPDPTCSTRQDEIWRWRDGGHLSVAGARSVTSQLAQALERALTLSA